MSHSWGKKSMQNVIKWQVGCASLLDWLTKNKKSLRWGKLPDVFLFISPAIGGGKRVLAAAARGKRGGANHSVRQRALPFMLLLLCICNCIAHQSVCLGFSLSACLFVCLSFYLPARPLSVSLSVLCLVHFLLLCQFRTGNFKHGNHAQATTTATAAATTRATVATAAATITTSSSTCLLVFHVVFKVFSSLDIRIVTLPT